MFGVVSSDGIKLWANIVVPITFTATISFGLHAVVAICVRFTALYALAYFFHHITVQYLFY
jgi:hypothetical protein